MPMDSSPYESFSKEMMESFSLADRADLHVVKVAGKLEGVRKLTNHASNQGKCAELFFVRLLKKEKECELEAIKSHASKTTEEEKELQDMYMVFQPRCFRRPTFMKDLPHLDMETLKKDLEITATILWQLPMELQGDCIVSAVAPNHECHPIKQIGIDMKHITQHYQWTPKEGWSNKLQRARRSQKSKAPQGLPYGMPLGTPYLPQYDAGFGGYEMHHFGPCYPGEWGWEWEDYRVPPGLCVRNTFLDEEKQPEDPKSISAPARLEHLEPKWVETREDQFYGGKEGAG